MYAVCVACVWTESACIKHVANTTLCTQVPVRIKGRQDILHIYEEDKNFALSKTEVDELVGEYKHSLTLVFGDSSSESEGEQSGGE